MLLYGLSYKEHQEHRNLRIEYDGWIKLLRELSMNQVQFQGFPNLNMPRSNKPNKHYSSSPADMELGFALMLWQVSHNSRENQEFGAAIRVGNLTNRAQCHWGKTKLNIWPWSDPCPYCALNVLNVKIECVYLTKLSSSETQHYTNPPDSLCVKFMALPLVISKILLLYFCV